MEDEGIISLECPHCRKTAEFSEMDIGQIQECPFCPEVFIVPDRNGEAAKPLPLPHQTQRLILRQFRREDYGDVVEFMTDQNSFQAGSSALDQAEVEEWLDGSMKAKLTQPNGALCLGIQVVETGKVIGTTSIRYADSWNDQKIGRAVEIDLNIHPAFQQQGCGTEALAGLLELCFRGLNFRKVVSSFDNRNEAWHRTLAKAGFRKEGVFVENYLINNEWVDTAYYAILRRDLERRL
jgi:[ribosomal protein S5]-alanine N-acetyltransferase